MIEITIKVSDNDSSLTQKYIEDEGFVFSHDEPRIRKLVDQAIKDFGKPIEDCVVKMRADW